MHEPPRRPIDGRRNEPTLLAGFFLLISFSPSLPTTIVHADTDDLEIFAGSLGGWG